MPGYVWRKGKAPEQPAPKPVEPAKDLIRPSGRCGTRWGYTTHRKYGEEACQPCKDAETAYSNEYRAKVRSGERKPDTAFSPDRCGTRTGYVRHRIHRVPACKPCLAANAAASLKWKRKPA